MSPSVLPSVSPSVSPSTSRSGSPVLRDQGSSLYHRKVANTTEGGKRSAELTGQNDRQDEDEDEDEDAHGLGEEGIRRDSKVARDSRVYNHSVDLIGAEEWKRGNQDSLEGGSGRSGRETTDRVECTRDGAGEKNEETKGEETCQEPIPDVSAKETCQSNKPSEANISESFDSTLRVFLVCLLISLLYFTLPLFSFILLLLAVFLFLLYGKQSEKLFS